MPETEVVFFAKEDGSVPLLGWLDGVPAKVQDKCIARIELLAAMGYELRRPIADTLRDGISELRVIRQKVHYRMLYFFHGRTAVVSHGLTKEGEVPPREIDLALSNKFRFEADPEKHTYRETVQ